MSTGTTSDRPAQPDSSSIAPTPNAATPNSPTPPPVAATRERMQPADRRLLILLLASAFVVILNETTMSVALSPIMDDFGISAAAGQWLTTAFLLTMAVVIPTTGWLLGRLGTRRAFLIAMTTFTVGTVLAALAPTFGVLLGARVVQASGTAIMMPLLMTTVMRIVPPSSRGAVMGTVSMVIAAAPALGPSTSGLVLRWFSWHWIFGLVAPIALAALICGFLWVRGLEAEKAGRLDVVSIPLAVLGFGGLVWGLSALGEAAHGAPPVAPWLLILIGVVGVTGFVLRQLQKNNDALLNVRVLRVRDFTVSVVLMCLAMFAMFGVMLLLPLMLQRVLNLEPLDAGLLMLPGALAMGLLGPVVGRWYDRVGGRPLVVPGLGLASIGLVLLAAGPQAIWLVLTAHIIMSLGMALVFTPMFTASLSSLAGPMVPHGSATIGTMQQLFGAAGTATFVAIMSSGEAAGLADGLSAEAALSAGTRTAFWVGAGVLAAAALFATTLRRVQPSEAGVPAGH